MNAWTFILTILVVAMAVVIALLWRHIRVAKRKQERMDALRRFLEKERPALVQMIRLSGDDESRQLIRKRSELLDRLLAAGVSRDSVRSDAVMDEVDELVAERNEFMRQTRLIYERMQPQLIEHLRGRGLTDEEIEICCLYALGLNGKEIQQYTKDGRHYQNVGLIRRKLGLGEHDKNIDGYIRSLLK